MSGRAKRARYRVRETDDVALPFSVIGRQEHVLACRCPNRTMADRICKLLNSRAIAMHVSLTREQAEDLLVMVDPIDGGAVDAAEILNLPLRDTR